MAFFTERELRREEVQYIRQQRFQIEQLAKIREAQLSKPLGSAFEKDKAIEQRRPQSAGTRQTQKQLDKQNRRKQNEKAKTYALRFKRLYRNMLHDRIVEQIQLRDIMRRRMENTVDSKEKARLELEMQEKDVLISGWRVEESGLDV